VKAAPTATLELLLGYVSVPESPLDESITVPPALFSVVEVCASVGAIVPMGLGLALGVVEGFADAEGVAVGSTGGITLSDLW
jgi:hypothetical protein